MKNAIILATLLSITVFAPLEVACTNPIVQDIVDCAKENQNQLTAEGAKLIAMIPDWPGILAAATADAGTLGYKVVGCVLADMTNGVLLKQSASLSDAQTLTVKGAMEMFRTKHTPHGSNTLFRTKAGDL